MNQVMKTNWIFDPTPPSGARTGGDVAEYAFTPGIEVFVREVLQNAKDQHAGGPEPVSVVFRLVKLEGKSLEAFLEGIGWEVLRPHIAAAGESENGASYKLALDKLDETAELSLLIVEDRNTGGLMGPETGDGNFAALCLDTLFSKKPDATAGGSYGLGKAVLWRFSALSTVLFNSNLIQLEKGQSNPRFIGRVSLPWHKLGSKEYSGGGWFGESKTLARGQSKAQSLWGTSASDLASKLGLSRQGVAAGTSILVVGLDEPARETRPLDQLAQEIERAASIWFWPSITDKTSTLEVSIEVVERGRTVLNRTVTAHQAVKPFVDAMWDYQSGTLKGSLQEPGDTVVVPITVRLPSRRDASASGIDAEATLVIKLAEPEASVQDPHRNSVACFRGPGMVVEYRKFERLSLTARPFHALLVCGNAQVNGATDENKYFDEFLRAAEPPEHHRWVPTKRLKDTYKTGYKKALDSLNEALRQRLKEAVSEKITGGQEGPQLLMRKFPVGSAAGGGSEQQPFEFRDLAASLDASGFWIFVGTIIARTNIDKGWVAIVDMRFADEGGGRGEGGMIGSLDASAGKVKIEKGKATVTLPSTIRQVRISGRTDPALHPVSARLGTVELVLNGKKN
jgi:hypothetical protein